MCCVVYFWITRAQASEILGSLRGLVVEKFHDDSANRLAANGHVEENAWSCHALLTLRLALKLNN